MALKTDNNRCKGNIPLLRGMINIVRDFTTDVRLYYNTLAIAYCIAWGFQYTFASLFKRNDILQTFNLYYFV